MTRPPARIHRLLLPWAAFLVAQLALCLVALSGAGASLGDVTFAYRNWAMQALGAGPVPGFQEPWVYPALALLPLLGAVLLGGTGTGLTTAWLVLVVAASALAFGLLLGRGRSVRRRRAAYGWILLALALGPITVGRVDAFALVLALSGALLLAARPRTAGALLTLGAWVKVWPGLLWAAGTLAARRPRALIASALIVCAAVAAAVGISGGGLDTLLGFLGAQDARALQIEAPAATPFIWAALLGNEHAVHFNAEIITYEVSGPGTLLVAALTTPALVLLGSVVLLLGVRARARGARLFALMVPMSTAFIATAIALNRVVSPQFLSWLIVPAVLALAWGRPHARPLALGIAALGLLTQAIYPFGYRALLALDPVLVTILSVRNLGLLVLLAASIVMLARTGARPQPRRPVALSGADRA